MYKVFVVDDEKRVRERLKTTIDWESLNMQFCGEASDGEIALAMINEIKPDILITDIEMPFVDGLSLTKIVKDSNPNIETVVISGYDEFEYARKALELGVYRYILKPITIKEIYKIMNKVKEELDKKNANAVSDSFSNNREMDKLFENLIHGEISVSDILTKCEELNINLLSTEYCVVDIKIVLEDIKDFSTVKEILKNTFTKEKNVLWYYRTHDKLILIIKKQDDIDLNEKSSVLISSVKENLLNNVKCTFSVGIGNIVNRITEIATSYSNAIKLRNETSNYEELFNNSKDDFNTILELFDSSFLEKNIKHLDISDVKDIVAKYLKPVINSKNLFFYSYMVTDAYVCACKLIKSLQGEPTEVLPEIDSEAYIIENCKTKEKMEQILIYILETTVNYREEVGGLKYSNIIKEAKDYIKENYWDSNLNLKQVAKIVALSPNHFSTVFSNATGKTFIEYLTNVRLSESKRLLETTNLKLFDISEKIGYKESHYYSFIFKKYNNITPTEYRKNKKV